MSWLLPWIGSAGLVAAMLIGPAFSHPEFSSIADTTSELAGQNMPGAWIMRAGFFLYGASALWAAANRLTADPLRHLPVVLFGLGLIGAAIWSSHGIDPALGVDWDEDWMHSFLASALGFAFALACSAWLFLPHGDPWDLLSWTGLIASVALPLAMMNIPDWDGAIQRVMFSISMVWLIRGYGQSSSA